ncbi:MAG TPA: protein kinase [Terriglobales bacterium]|nr:protein kinase [Terriglobales bacterium]
MALAPGTKLGPYEVISPLGAGGMGEVYRGRDLKLNRDIAIKILPDLLAKDQECLARFRREAQLLAALNHPHIAHIHGFEDSSGAYALIMELVEGPTLAEKMMEITGRAPGTPGMPLDEALAIAKQLADALEAAHERGIVHRDFKPGNIKITADGTVKVLDFGLAKAVADGAGAKDLAQSPTLTLETSPGVVVGTVSYMSPEQARGLPVDKRADIWAFGSVLYEMLAGRKPFAGDTKSDIMANVLLRPPDWGALPAGVPAPVMRLLRRCLEKDARRRLHDMGDALLDLEEAGTPATAESKKGAAPRRFSFLEWLAASLLILLAVAAGWLLRPHSLPENPLANAHFTRLTDWEGLERDAAISPDGKFVAFVSDRDGPFDIWLAEMGAGVFVNLTHGREANLDFELPVVGFANGGSQLWIHDANPTTPLRLAPLMGGEPRTFLAKGPGQRPPVNAAWSPDGSQLVYHTSDPGDPLYVADRTGGNPHLLFRNADPGMHNHFPVWSPDGRWIYFARGNPVAASFDLWRISPSGGKPERLTTQSTWLAYPAPLGSHTVLYVARGEDGSGPWLWALNPDDKSTRRVSFGLEQYTSVAASANGRRLVATVANPSANLWSVPIADHPAGEGEVTRFPLPTVRALAPRFAGTLLFYLSSHGAGDGLWRYDQRQAIEIWKGADGPLFEAAAISPDGSQVAIGLRTDGKLRLHLMTADGSDLHSIGEGIEVQGTAAWSPDGKWIVTGGRGDHGLGLFKIPVAGGSPTQILTGQAFNPVWSPDGSLIVYTGANVGPDAPLLAVRPDGTAVALPAIRVRRDGVRARFLPSGKGLVYMQGRSAAQDFWLLDVASKKSRPLTQLHDPSAMRAFDITADGKHIVFDRLRENSDLVLVDLEK